jgi:hypothetical protein
MHQPATKKYIPVILIITVFFSLLAVLAVVVQPANAQSTDSGPYEPGWVIIPPECLGRQAAGDKPCDLDSFINLFVNLAKVGLKVLPYITMIMVIWAGFNLIMAGGNPTKIEEGKRMVSSIVIGVIVILVLAWGFSYFIVYTLTCNPQDKASCEAKLFYGYPWQKEWWGGGEAHLASADLGCCVNTTAQWCQERLNEEDCEAQGGSFQGKGSACEASKAVCDNYAAGCCVPDNPTDTDCQSPSSIEACKNLSGYHNVTDRICLEIEQCLAGSQYVFGCCVPDLVPDEPDVWNLCQLPQPGTLCGEYAGTTFRQSLACNNFPICKSGCCVPYCGTATSRASEYWCGNQHSGATKFHSGSCNNLETDVANCCAIPLANSNNYRCLYADSGNQINRQYCEDLGGIYDEANCQDAGLTCQILLPIDNTFCNTP